MKARTIDNNRSSQRKTILPLMGIRTKETPHSTAEKARETLASAKDTAQSAYTQVQEGMRVRWSRARAWMAISIGILVALLQKNMQQAQKNWEQAQQNLQEMQSNVGPRLSKSLQAIGERTGKARQSVSQAAVRAQEMKGLWQEQAIERKQRRKRAKMMFRAGLIIGAVAALLYTPLAGPETYQRLVRHFQRYRLPSAQATS